MYSQLKIISLIIFVITFNESIAQNNLFVNHFNNPAFTAVKNQPTLSSYDLLWASFEDANVDIRKDNFILDAQYPFLNNRLGVGAGTVIAPDDYYKSYYGSLAYSFKLSNEDTIRLGYKYDYVQFDFSSLIFPDQLPGNVVDTTQISFSKFEYSDHRIGLLYLSKQFYGGLKLNRVSVDPGNSKPEYYFDFQLAYRFNVNNELNIMTHLYSTYNNFDEKIIAIEPYFVLKHMIWINPFYININNARFKFDSFDLLFKAPRLPVRIGVSSREKVFSLSLSGIFNINNQHNEYHSLIF